MTRQRDHPAGAARIDQQQTDPLATVGDPALFVCVVTTAKIQRDNMLLFDHVPDHPGGQHGAWRVCLERFVVRQLQYHRPAMFNDPELGRDGNIIDPPDPKSGYAQRCGGANLRGIE